MSVGTYGWETLSPHEGGNRLLDKGGTHQISGKIRTNGHTKGSTYMKAWSEESGWTHIVLDAKHNVVAQGFGRLEKDSWAMTEAILKHKGYLAP